VETAYQLSQVRQAGCGLVQGHLTGFPMNAADLERSLERHGMPAAFETAGAVWHAGQKSQTPWLAP
jgi:predicted signal transduction protein with EAL and GGDEF domain